MDINSPLGYKRGAEEHSQNRGGSWDTGLRWHQERGRGDLCKESSTGGNQHPVDNLVS